MTENGGNEDVANENKEHRIDEILTSEDVDDESKENRMAQQMSERHGIYT